ncbi:MAG: IS200/IS605 family transposase [Phycisphaeraceae bacterium]
MGHTYINLLLHIVFSTKNREPFITAAIQDRLHAYLGGIAREEFGTALAIGGMPDHIHALILLKAGVSLAHAMNRFKSLSSGWLKKEFPEMNDFAWQAGYGAFAVSESVKPSVIEYINHQAEHHRTMTFQEEFVAFLKRHHVPFDPEKLWD